MKYKGYSAKVIFDEEANIFHGEVVGIKDVVTFQGVSVEELQREFECSVDEYLEFCEELDREPEKPFSGKLMLRLSPETHERAAYEARSQGVSLNTWLKTVITQLLSQKGDSNQNQHLER